MLADIFLLCVSIANDGSIGLRDTLPNCGKVLKHTPTKHGWKHPCGRGNDLGYGNSGVLMVQWIIRSQVPQRVMAWDAVQRLNGSGLLLLVESSVELKI